METKDEVTRRPRVLILGGGFAGLQAARGLGRLPVDVVLLDRNSHHVFQPLLYQAAMAILSPSDIARPIRSILRRFPNVRVLLGEAVSIDRERRKVTLRSNDELHYDYLILATGSNASYFGHEEWSENAPALKTIEDAVEIRTRVLSVFEAAESAIAAGRPAPKLHFAVIGGGPTGVELAGAIADMSKDVLKKDYRYIDTSTTQVSLFEGASTILGTFPHDLRCAAGKQLQKRGVTIRTGSKISDIQNGIITVGNELIPTSLTLWAAGVKPSQLGQALGLRTDRSGCVIVDSYLNPAGEPNIFVCGDVAAVSSGDGRVPAVAQPAMQMGRHAAEQIAADLAGRSRTPFHYFDKGDMATIGVRSAVARIKWPFKADLSGFPAWISWLVIHLAFLSGRDRQFSVLFTWIYSYVSRSARSRLVVHPHPRVQSSPDSRGTMSHEVNTAESR